MFFVLLLLLFVVFFAIFPGVLTVLVGHRVLDVDMVTSPLVGIGHHRASMLYKQTHNTVTRIELSVYTQPAKQPNLFLSWDVKIP
jgi:hypothetical protein